MYLHGRILKLKKKLGMLINMNQLSNKIPTYFLSKTVHIIKNRGLYGLIIPNAWIMVYSGEGLRRFLLNTCTLDQIINLEGYSFESANVETVILIAYKGLSVTETK